MQYFLQNEHLFKTGAEAIVSACTNDPQLKPMIQFIKYRVKDPLHLHKKILRKIEEARQSKLARDISPDNLFSEITDLAGVRILHLYSDQIVDINQRLIAIFKSQQCRLIEGPIANCWDSDTEAFYKHHGIQTKQRNSMYASVHYTVELSPHTKVCCELQVRTVADEIWGEVSHAVNYPSTTDNEACIEQLKVLARLTSGCTWLVNSIFRSKGQSQRQVRDRVD